MRVKNSTLILVMVFLIVLSIYFGGGYLMWNHYFRYNATNAGTFGDMFGVITSFFSAATVILVFYAANLQKQELDETRAEIREQVTAAKKMSETADKQNKNQILQRFESTLFNLMSLHNKNVDNIHTVHGQNAFNQCLAEILQRFAAPNGQGNNYENYFPEMHGEFMDKYITIIGDGSAKLITYFKHIVITLSFIQRSKISKDSKLFYVTVFTSQLTSDELTLVYYHIGLDPKINNDQTELQSFCLQYEVFSDLKEPTNHTHLRFFERLKS